MLAVTLKEEEKNIIFFKAKNEENLKKIYFSVD